MCAPKINAILNVMRFFFCSFGELLASVFIIIGFIEFKNELDFSGWCVCDQIRPSKLDYAGSTIWMGAIKQKKTESGFFVGSLPTTFPNCLAASNLAVYSEFVHPHSHIKTLYWIPDPIQCTKFSNIPHKYSISKRTKCIAFDLASFTWNCIRTQSVQHFF